MISLRLADIASQIPEAARLPAFNAEHCIELPCKDVFTGPAPKLLLSRLAEIAGEHVRLDGVPDSPIRLPAAQLALGYHFINGRELLEEPVQPEDESPGPQKVSHPPEEFAPKGDISKRDIFPIFRRKGVEPQVKPPAAPPHVEFPKPRAPFVPTEFSSRPPQAAPSEAKAVEPEPEAVEQPVKELALAAPAQEAILVETEHLPKSESKRSAEIPDQDALQALFMTEEFLSVDRVVELCGGLPGVKSCVLAHGSVVLASHNVPESIDLVSLSAHALEMLAAMRQSAARMGVGAVPAVTIHSEKGPITFFHQDDLCLLVLHKDRGFVPGVREKLQQVVEHLSEANLALPVGASRPALAQKEATF
jgi:predicted regulator of Ras-like GTPase activity (Roadblock/LC7/MglB family)